MPSPSIVQALLYCHTTALESMREGTAIGLFKDFIYYLLLRLIRVVREEDEEDDDVVGLWIKVEREIFIYFFIVITIIGTV